MHDTTGVFEIPSSTLYWNKSYAASRARKISKRRPRVQKATAGFEPGGAWCGIVSLTSAAAPRLFQTAAGPECPTASRHHKLCVHGRSCWRPPTLVSSTGRSINQTNKQSAGQTHQQWNARSFDLQCVMECLGQGSRTPTSSQTHTHTHTDRHARAHKPIF